MSNFDDIVKLVQSQEVAKKIQEKCSNDDKLKLYGLFKVATVGKVQGQKPGIFSQKERAKWTAWEAESGKTADQAKTEYVGWVGQLRSKYGF